MALDDPTQKMSKSAARPASSIQLTDGADAIRKKIKSAVTDSGTEVRRGPGKEGIANLIEILSVVRGTAPEEVEREFDGSGYGDFKSAVADAVVEYLTPVRDRYAELRPDTDALERTLAAGADKARAIASGTLADVREAMGVGPADVT